MAITSPRWENQDEAQKAIKRALHPWRRSRKRWDRRGHCEIVRQSVASNTYRGFPMKGPPSFVFRTWGWLFLKSGRLGRVTSQESFDNLHKALCLELSDCWKCVATKTLSCGGAVKLIDLLIQLTCKHDHKLKNRKVLLNYIHVPLDKYVLKAIRGCDVGVRIPSNPSMGNVKSYKDYMRIQGFIRHLARASGTEPAILNYVAWERTHTVRERHR
jgi:hypothetical protein